MDSKKNIVCLDVETTGLNPKDDFIIQLSLVKIDRDTFDEIDSRNWYIKPSRKYEIAPAAQEVHGITKEYLEANGVLMKQIAPEAVEFIGDCDILTYNGNTFDMKFIEKDFRMAGVEFSFENRKFYDSYGIEAKLHPRTLVEMYKKYTGKELEGAHDSLSDVRGTIAVFARQLSTNALTFDDIADWNECNLLSPEGSIRRTYDQNNDEQIIFAIGKYRDSEFMKVYEKDPQYIKWFGENVASTYTKRILNEYCRKHKKPTKKVK